MWLWWSALPSAPVVKDALDLPRDMGALVAGAVRSREPEDSVRRSEVRWTRYRCLVLRMRRGPRVYVCGWSGSQRIRLAFLQRAGKRQDWAKIRSAGYY
jgi:hypothetical protein